MRSGGRVRLVLVRHGETGWNADRRWQGQAGEGLSARGHEQARATAAHLLAQHGDAALLARSDSQRVEETAAPLAAVLDLPVLVDPRLREVDVGSWSGLTRTEVQDRDPEGWAAYRRGEAARVGGGETVAEVRARARAAIDDVVSCVGDGTAIVMTHGWTLRILVGALLGEEADALPRAPNCSITILDVAPGAVDRVSYANCEHLPAGALMPQHGTAPSR